MLTPLGKQDAYPTLGNSQFSLDFMTLVVNDTTVVVNAILTFAFRSVFCG